MAIDTESEYKGPGVLKRFALGGLLIIVVIGAATAVAGLHEVDKVVNALRQNKPLKLGGELSEADAGKPQTLLLLGSDKRPGEGDNGRSDTIMLVRLDPSKDATTIMSLPRDLKVTIPGHGVDKINDAYTLGGPKLTVKTVKQVTGLRINHVINVDFQSFRYAVDRLGCVYIDVDRRYYNADPSYAPINIQAGYRRLCGLDALLYVRFRHEDTDIVRGARQQDFLRQVKDQVGAGKLFDEKDALLKIFGKYTTSDIRSRDDVLRILKLAVFSAGRPIEEIHFEGQLGPSYVTASDAQVKKLAQRFLAGKASTGPRGTLKPKGRHKKKLNDLQIGLENAQDAGKEQALQVVAGGGVRYPIVYPTKRTQGALYQGPPTVYTIKGNNGKSYRSYRMVIRRGGIGEFYGLQATSWKDPPILKSPSQTVKSGGREYQLYYDGDRVRIVAWKTPQATYWVSNTLLQSLSKKQMLGIARSARPL
jgi:polyisoprenyl-teichoic acid--peptidoglycan teichoic acid transferase